LSDDYRPPCDAEAHTPPEIPYGDDFDGLERRVCPNCRYFFDTGEDSDRVFCGYGCSWRHERGVYL
jgi:hypothetical protein